MAKLTASAIFLVGLICVQGVRITFPERRTSPFPGEITKRDPRCKYDGIFPIPNDCNSFLSCKNGSSQTRRCPADFKFDSAKHCTPDKPVDCGYPTQKQAYLNELCVDYYGIFDYPDECNKYVFCKEGTGTLKTCPQGQLYQQNVGCVNGDTCTGIVRPEARCVHDGFFPDPKDCTEYRVCKNGTGITRVCPEGFKFDSIQHCTLDERADCGFPTQKEAYLSTLCVEYYGIFAYPDDCHKYVICHEGKGTLKTCPQDQVYQDNVGCVKGDVCPPRFRP